MGKETKRRLFIVLTAVLLMLSVVAGIMFGYKPVQAETTGVFTVTGGSYQFGTRADKTVDGLPLTITPTASGNDVKLEYNGVYRRAANPSGSFWGFRQLTNLNGGVDGAVPDAKALIFTYKAINDESKSFSFVMTKDAMYFSLISDISFDDNGLPYVTGTEQYLQKAPTNNVGFSTRKALALYVSNDADGSVYVADNTVMLKLSNEAWLASSSANLSGKQKEMYDPARALSLSRDEDLRCCKWEFTAVGLQSEATILLRHFDGNNYYNGGTNYLEIQKPRPAIYTNHNALIKSNGTSYALTDLYNTEYVTSTTGNYIQGFTTTDTTALTTSGEIRYLDWGKGTWTKTNFTHGASKVYTVMQLISGASDAMPHSPYYYGAFDVVEGANEVITQKADKLISGEKYKASELFKNLSTLNKCDSNLELLISTEENGTYSSIGTLDGDYEYTAGTGESVTFYVKVKDTELAAKGKPCETAASAFSFVVGNETPEVNFKGISGAISYGTEINPSSAFEIVAHEGYTVKYYVDGVELSSSVWRPLVAGTYTVKCEVSYNGLSDYAEGEITVDGGNEFAVKNGYYTLGAKADATVNGLPLTIKPQGSKSDVTLAFNGAYRTVQWSGSGWGASRWAGRLLIDFAKLNEKAEGFIITYRDPGDFNREISLVLTQKGTYVSLVSDISIDASGVPFITGTEQELVYLRKTYHGANIGYYISDTDGKIVFTDTKGEEFTPDAAWFKNSSDKLPESLKGRYTEENYKSLYTSMLSNGVMLELKALGLTGEHTINLRQLYGTAYYSSQATLKFRTVASPLIIPKTGGVVKGAAVNKNLTDLFDVLYANPSDLDYIQGFTTSDTTKLTTENGYSYLKWASGTWSKSTISVGSTDTYYVVQYLTKGSLTNGDYVYGKISAVSSASEAVFAARETLIAGKNYAINELFKNKRTLDMFDDNLEVFVATEDGGTYNSVGKINGSYIFTPVEKTENSYSYSIWIKIKDSVLNQTTEASCFTFTVIKQLMITLNVDGATENVSVVSGEEFTLPSKTVSGKVFIGWIKDNNLYPAGYKITVNSNTSFEALFAVFSVDDEASVRITEPYGVRFISHIDKAFADKLTELNVLNQYYTNISSNIGNHTLKINIDSSKIYTKGNELLFNSAIINIKEYNYSRVFFADSYIVITFSDGTVKEFKATTAPERQGRSYAQVIEAASNDYRMSAEEDYNETYNLNGTTVYVQDAELFGRVLDIKKDVWAVKAAKPVLVKAYKEIETSNNFEEFDFNVTLPSFSIGETIDLTAFFVENAPEGYSLNTTKGTIKGVMTSRGFEVTVYFNNNTFATNGSTNYVTVVDKDAAQHIWAAKGQIYNYVKDSTGAEMQSWNDENGPFTINSRVVSIGNNKITEQLKEEGYLTNADYEKLSYDGYFIKKIGNMIVIDSNTAEGIVYGAFGFLKSVLGVEFYAQDVESVPSRSTVVIDELNIVDNPAFNIRDYYSNPIWYSEPIENAKFAINSPSMTKNIQTIRGNGLSNKYYGYFYNDVQCATREGHTVTALLQAYAMNQGWISSYSQAVDDYSSYRGNIWPAGCIHKKQNWYAYVGNNFERRNKYGYSPEEVCWTNGLKTSDWTYDSSNTDSLASVLIDICMTMIKSNKNKDAEYLMLGFGDYGAQCQCNNCKKSYSENGTFAGATIVMINAIAKEVKTRMAAQGINRTVKFVLFSYSKGKDAPVTKNSDGSYSPLNARVKLREDVNIKMAYRNCVSHALNDMSCSNNAELRERFKQWGALLSPTSEIAIWDYTCNFTDYLWYVPNFEAIKSNYQYYKTINVNHLLSQGCPGEWNFYENKIHQYVSTKLMWDPEQDVNKLISSFDNVYFGNSKYAAYVSEYRAIMDKMYSDKGIHASTDNGLNNKVSSTYDATALKNAVSKLQSAITAVKADASLSSEDKILIETRIRSVLITPQYMLLRLNLVSGSEKTNMQADLLASVSTLGLTYYKEGSLDNCKFEYLKNKGFAI